MTGSELTELFRRQLEESGAEMLHGRRKGFLASAGGSLYIVNYLKVDPVLYPIPVEIMDNYVLFHDTPVVAAPGKKCRAVSAPFAECVKCFRK